LCNLLIKVWFSCKILRLLIPTKSPLWKKCWPPYIVNDPKGPLCMMSMDGRKCFFCRFPSCCKRPTVPSHDFHFVCKNGQNQPTLVPISISHNYCSQNDAHFKCRLCLGKNEGKHRPPSLSSRAYKCWTSRTVWGLQRKGDFFSDVKI
jgi:hypothetical protein